VFSARTHASIGTIGEFDQKHLVLVARHSMPRLMQDLLLSAPQVRASARCNDWQAMGNVA
jgi:hypothetical protein